jgi:DNA polymerase-1
MFKIPLDQVDSTVRRKAKAINFGLIYGMSAHGLAKQINVPRKEAKIYMDAYFQQYPKVKLYMENIVKFAATHGYVETFNGKKLNFNKIFSAKGVIKSSIERAAINAPMQGSAAQIIKQAMIEIYNLIKDKQDEILMVLQVHDELVFEIREDKVDEYADKIVDIMQNVAKLKVPLKVEVGVSDNWSGAH